MAQVRLRNDNKVWSRKGSLVRVNPENNKGFLHAEYTDIGIIGRVIESKPPKHFCLINLINVVLWDDVIKKPDDLLTEKFEEVSRNLKSYPYVISYNGDDISYITYNLGGGKSITKTFNYTLGVLTSIVLSGDTPASIELTKTLSYTGVDLTSVTYT